MADLATVFEDVTDIAVSHIQALGVFEAVNGHEPKSSPGTGITCAVWVDSLQPDPTTSGVNASAGLLVLNARIYTSMTQQPEDAIDPAVLRACGRVIEAFSTDLTFEGLLLSVDPFGMAGVRMEARAGYLNHSGGMYRVMTITIPLIIDALWPQQS